MNSFAIRIFLAVIGVFNTNVLAISAKIDEDRLSVHEDNNFNRRRLGSPKKRCNAGFVTCIDGWLPDRSRTCDDYCNGKCCQGTNACANFTGSICKDSSCIGEDSCRDARVGLIVDGCIGKGACHGAGANGGYVFEIKKSCSGDEACAYAACDEGNVQTIERSCSGTKACNRIAEAGVVGLIIDGCNAETACDHAAVNNKEGIDVIQNACNAMSACSNTAVETNVTAGFDDNITMAEIVGCCNDAYGCAYSGELPAECNGSNCEIYTKKNVCEANGCDWVGNGPSAGCKLI